MAPMATGAPAAEGNGDAKPSMASVPSISLEPLVSPSATEAERQETARSLLRAFQDYGFFYLTSYESVIPANLVQRVFAQSAYYFALPLAFKEKQATLTPEANKGYNRIGREKTSMGMTKEEVEKSRQEEGGDLKESLEIGREGQEEVPNRWWADDKEAGAEGAQEFKDTMLDLYARCNRMHQVLMRGVAVGLDLNEDYFDSCTRVGDNNLRLLHYPPVAAGGFEGGKRVRAGAHTDYGSVTLLFQDSRGGLQVEPPESALNKGAGWINVEPREGTIVVNAGDLLSRWSNDLIRSTRHRVVEPPVRQGENDIGHPARYSVAYFCNPDFDCWIEALPGTWEGEKGGRKYPGVNSGDYLMQRLRATYVS